MNKDNIEKHRMIGSFDAEANPIWMCPYCGHVLAFPNGKATVINRGDFRAQHYGFAVSRAKYPEGYEGDVTMEHRFLPPIVEKEEKEIKQDKSPLGWYEGHAPSPTSGVG